MPSYFSIYQIIHESVFMVTIIIDNETLEFKRCFT